MIKIDSPFGKIEAAICVERVHLNGEPRGQVMEIDGGYLAVPYAKDSVPHARTFSNLSKALLWAATTPMQHDSGVFRDFEEVTQLAEDTAAEIMDIIRAEQQKSRTRFDSMSRKERMRYVVQKVAEKYS